MNDGEEPDFDALRVQRTEAFEQIVQSVCDELGWDRDKVSVSACGCQGCYCACPEGPCEHEFEGLREFEDGTGCEAVCKHCGLGAMAHDSRFAP